MRNMCNDPPLLSVVSDVVLNRGGFHGSTEWGDIQEGYKRIQRALMDEGGSGHRRALQAEEMVCTRKCEGVFRKAILDLHLGHRMHMEAGETIREMERSPEELNMSMLHGRREQL